MIFGNEGMTRRNESALMVVKKRGGGVNSEGEQTGRRRLARRGRLD